MEVDGAFLHHTRSDHVSLSISMSRKIHRKSIRLDIARLGCWRKRDKPTGPPREPAKNPQCQNAIIFCFSNHLSRVKNHLRLIYKPLIFRWQVHVAGPMSKNHPKFPKKCLEVWHRLDIRDEHIASQIGGYMRRVAGAVTLVPTMPATKPAPKWSTGPSARPVCVLAKCLVCLGDGIASRWVAQSMFAAFSHENNDRKS